MMNRREFVKGAAAAIASLNFMLMPRSDTVSAEPEPFSDRELQDIAYTIESRDPLIINGYNTPVHPPLPGKSGIWVSTRGIEPAPPYPKP